MFAATTEQQTVGFGDLECIAAMTLQALRLQGVMRHGCRERQAVSREGAGGGSVPHGTSFGTLAA